MAALHTPPSTIDCWGDGYNNGQITTTATPTPIDARTDWTLVRSHFDHSCAIAGDGSVWCWGDNVDGQLGVGDTHYRVPPTLVALPGPADDLVLGGNTTCAVIAGAYWCWGRNDGGELGNGAAGSDVLAPVQRCAS